MSINRKVNLLGIEIDNENVNYVIDYIKKSIVTNNKSIISYANIHALNLCYEIEWFHSFINESQVIFCDGYGVHLGARLTGQKLDHRFTPPDWIDLVCKIAEKNNWTLFFLGAKPGVAKVAAEKLQSKYPKLKISEHNGYFDHFGTENERVLQLINESKAKIILVGMGMPLQERWIKENFKHLPTINIFLPVGALFDYLANTIPRGPRILTDNGFEWLARLIIEPKRLWKRYLIGIPLFFIRVVKYHKANTNNIKKA